MQTAVTIGKNQQCQKGKKEKSKRSEEAAPELNLRRSPRKNEDRDANKDVANVQKTPPPPPKKKEKEFGDHTLKKISAIISNF